MLRKFIIPTVIVSILLLLTTLTNITKATSVTTSTTKTATTRTKTTSTSLLPSSSTSSPASIFTTTTAKTASAVSSNPSGATHLHSSRARKVAAKRRTTAEASVVKKFLNNDPAAAAAAVVETETTTSLLPLQPPLKVTSTTLASFILNQKHQQQQRQRQRQRQIKRKQQQQQFLLLQQKQQQQNKQQKQPIQEEQKEVERQNRQLQDVEAAQQQIHEHLINDNNNANDNNKEIKKKNLESSFVTVSSAFDVQTPAPSSSTHAYIPFDLDYNDPTEEKAAQAAQSSRQSTINEVLSNLFPKGFSDIFRFSYVGETETTTSPPIIVIKSTPTPFKPMPSTRTRKKDKADMPKNNTFVRVTTSVTREIRREVRPGHVEIVVEKVFPHPGTGKSNEDFRDGSNSISKDELLRINRAANEASVLPTLLINPQNNSTQNGTNSQTSAPIVILNENTSMDDFVDAPEDDNQIAETQDVVHQVYQPAPQPPPAESTNFQATPTHQYNVRIIHYDALRKAQDDELARQEQQSGRSSPSYQSFVEQSKLIQNSLQEAPSRKFLKNFQNPILTQNQNPAPVSKGNFHYEKNAAQSHIQTVPPAAQVHYVQQQLQPQAQQLQQEQPQSEQHQQLHIQVSGETKVNNKDFYDIDNVQHLSTPANLVFVTISPPLNVKKETTQLANVYGQDAQVIPAQPMKSPHEFVTNAMGYHQSQPVQVHPVENNPKPANNGYTFVEVQKSINIHNKLITEKDGRLIEQHETIYPEQKYAEPALPPATQEPAPEYVSLSQNPIHVEQEEEQHESAASLKAEQHAPSPTQNLGGFGDIQQSNLIQETHIIEAPQKLEEQAEHDYHEENQEQQYNQQYEQEQVEQQEEHHEEHAAGHYEPVEEIQIKIVGDHLTGEKYPQHPPAEIPYPPSVQIPYAPPPSEELTAPSAAPLVVKEIVEKHIPVPYGIPEPVGVPVHIQHFIDRPYPVETIVEKPVPYPVETVVEKVVEKHVPVEVEKIVEKPVEKVVNKYIDRPVAIPIKIPVALHLPPSVHGPPPPHFGHPPYYGGTPDFASTWPGGGTFARIPTNILKAYYTKMLKKLVPQMQQAYKNSPPTKGIPKLTPNSYIKPSYKISDILYDLKPPPRPKGKSSWDVGARYQYDYNTLPLDLSGSSSMAVSKQAERQTQGFKTNFDEYQRWRNGHSLKRSPDFGRNLHVEYGFKPPLVPSVEIDDKGVPLKAVADLPKGKED